MVRQSPARVNSAARYRPHRYAALLTFGDESILDGMIERPADRATRTKRPVFVAGKIMSD